MLKVPEGATIEEIVAATGWLCHYAVVRIMPMSGCKPLFLMEIAASESA